MKIFAAQYLHTFRLGCSEVKTGVRKFLGQEWKHEKIYVLHWKSQNMKISVDSSPETQKNVFAFKCCFFKIKKNRLI